MPSQQSSIQRVDLSSLVDYSVGEGLRSRLLPCLYVDPGLFFSDDPAQLEAAKTLCGGCPARRDCLTGALSRREESGVWGGQIFERGRVIPMKRRRGRPRRCS
jgi:hypothetical protein